MFWEKYRKIYYFFNTYWKKLGNGKIITYRLKFIGSFRFMSSKLSDLVDNLSEIYSKECKECKERKKKKSICNFIGLEKDVKKTVKTNKWIDWKVSKCIPILCWGHK